MLNNSELVANSKRRSLREKTPWLNLYCPITVGGVYAWTDVNSLMIFMSLNADLAKSAETETIEENQEYQNNKRAWIEIVLPLFFATNAP